MSAMRRQERSQEWSESTLRESLATADGELAELVASEERRQRESLSLLAPAMISSRSIRTLVGSGFADIDAEGYVKPADQSSTVQDLVDAYAVRGPSKYNPAGPFGEAVEALAMRRVAELAAETSGQIDAKDLHVNVHPLSGAIANVALLRAVLEPGDDLVGLDLRSGGHLTHGAAMHLSGMDYNSHPVPISESMDAFPYDHLVEEIQRWRPRVVLIGASSFPRKIDWRRVRSAVETVEPRPWLFADIAHFAGPVFAGLLPSPIDYVDATSFVWYKTLGGPRAATIVTSNAELQDRIDRSLFPGLQSAPNLGAISAIAYAAGFARSPGFIDMMSTALAIATALTDELSRRNLNVAYGGTDSHMLLWRPPVDARSLVALLERAGVLANANMLPGDVSAHRPSGIRMGTVSVAQRGLPVRESAAIADLIHEAVGLCGYEETAGIAHLEERRRRILSALPMDGAP